MNYAPTTGTKRIVTLDILRGISLLGILIANMLLFHTPFFYIQPYLYFTEQVDITAFKWISIFVQASFYPIFAFLFGYGIQMQYAKSFETGASFNKLTIRRLVLLLLFGVAHALLLWSGDILFTYAVLGFSLLLFVKLSPKALLIIATLLYTIPGLFLYALAKLVSVLGSEFLAEAIVDQEKFEQAFAIYGNGSFSEIFNFRLVEWLSFGLTSTFLGVFIVLPLMLFGVAMAKVQLFERASTYKTRLLIIGFISALLGVLIKSLPYLIGPTYEFMQLQSTFGGVFLAIGYVALFLVLTTSEKVRRIFMPFSYIGRMSFTTYLMQSFIATMIFYGIGFGHYGSVNIWTGTLIAFVIFIAQTIFAKVWLMKFKQGPLEKFWRIGIYGKKK